MEPWAPLLSHVMLSCVVPAVRRHGEANFSYMTDSSITNTNVTAHKCSNVTNFVTVRQFLHNDILTRNMHNEQNTVIIMLMIYVEI